MRVRPSESGSSAEESVADWVKPVDEERRAKRLDAKSLLDSKVVKPQFNAGFQ
jgi:hypothetical protein